MPRLTRRQFVAGAAAGAALLTRRLTAQPPPYDLVLRGGRVIDPSVRLVAVRDVASAGGRIAAVAPTLPPGGADVLDARGKRVVPGLLDVHAHYARDADGPSIALADGVTGWIDARVPLDHADAADRPLHHAAPRRGDRDARHPFWDGCLLSDRLAGIGVHLVP